MKRLWTRHGLSRHPSYRVWQCMRLRCLDPEHAAYPQYGGRGIGICKRWVCSVAAFIADMGPKPSPKHEIDREDNDAGYDCGACEDCHARGVMKTNCRWVTRHVNDRNRRSTRFLAFGGETMALVAWCERLGLPRDTVHKRLAAGWTVERALTVPVRPKAPNGTAQRMKAEAA